MSVECAGGQLLSSESHPDPCSSLLRAVAGADAASRGPCGQLDHAPRALPACIHSFTHTSGLPANSSYSTISSHPLMGTTLFPRDQEAGCSPGKPAQTQSCFTLGKLPWVLVSEPQNFHEMDGILDKLSLRAQE